MRLSSMRLIIRQRVRIALDRPPCDDPPRHIARPNTAHPTTRPGEMMILKKGKLISEIKIRPALWKEDHMHFRKKKVTSKLWDEVAALCNLPSGHDAKIKWKSLKDQYRREFQKYPPTSPMKSKWLYFDSLTFLQVNLNANLLQQTLHQDPPEPPSPPEPSQITPPPENTDFTDYLVQNYFQTMDTSGPIDMSVKPKRHKPEAKPPEKIIDDMFICPDLHFFKSLLPYMQQFSPLENLQVRSKIHAVILECFLRRELQVYRSMLPQQQLPEDLVIKKERE